MLIAQGPDRYYGALTPTPRHYLFDVEWLRHDHRPRAENLDFITNLRARLTQTGSGITAAPAAVLRKAVFIRQT